MVCIPFVFDLGLMMWLSRVDMVAKGEYSMPNNAFLYCNLVNQLPVFMFGIGSYFLEDGGYLRQGRWRVPGFLAALLLSVIGIVLLHGDRGLTFVILPTIAGASFACLFVAVRGITSIPQWLCRVGQVSYSMYIFPFIFASLLASRVLKMLGLGGGLVLLATWIVVIGCTYLVAMRTEHLIEAHGIDLGRRIIRRLQRREASPITTASRDRERGGFSRTPRRVITHRLSTWHPVFRMLCGFEHEDIEQCEHGLSAARLGSHRALRLCYAFPR